MTPGDHTKPLLLATAAALLLVGCASQANPTARPTTAAPSAWAQTKEERGQLRVGRVISAEKKSLQINDNPFTRSSSTMLYTGGLVGYALAAAMGGVPSPDEYFRYRIQVKDVAEPVVRDEFAAYPIGACVALRETPLMVVPALPDECP